MAEFRYFVGIDPDVTASGIGVVDVETKLVRAFTLPFDKLVYYLRDKVGGDTRVIIEAGWLNMKTTWHSLPTDTKAVAAKKGLSVGRNQQIAHDIADVCKAFGLPYAEVAPLLKCWAGKDRKITHEEITAVTGYNKGRSNQEERDALLLAWVHAGLPVVLPAETARKRVKCYRRTNTRRT